MDNSFPDGIMNKLLLDAHLDGAKEILEQKGRQVITVKELGITDGSGAKLTA